MYRIVSTKLSFFDFLNKKRRFRLTNLNTKTSIKIAEKLAIRDSKYKIGEVVRFRQRFYKISNISINSLTFDLSAIRNERFAKKGEVRYSMRSGKDIKFQTDGTVYEKPFEIMKSTFRDSLKKIVPFEQFIYKEENKYFVIFLSPDGEKFVVFNIEDDTKKEIENSSANIENICNNADLFGKFLHLTKYQN